MTSARISEKKNSKKERIIEAASALFSEKNFHEVMMTDVAQRASIAKGTLYNYYNSKEDLYFSVMLIRMENLISSLKKKIENENTALTSLHTFVIHNYMFLMKYQCFFRMYQRENLNASNLICDALRNKNSELREILFRILCEGISQKIFRTVDQELVTDLILGAIFAAVNKGIKDNYTTEVQIEEREKIYNFIINGLLNDLHGLSMKQRRILITRSENEAEDFASQLNGEQIIFLPAIEVTPSNDRNVFAEICSVLINCDYLILTSAHSARVLAERFNEYNLAPDYSKTAVAVVGRKTAMECQKHSIPVHMIPDNYSSEGLTELFSSMDLNGKRILIPGSALSNDTLPEYLKQRGAIARVIGIYDSKMPAKESVKAIIEEVLLRKPEIFVFTSPSAFRNFLGLMGISDTLKYFEGTIIAAIGNTTRNQIEQCGLKVNILPGENTLTGLGRSVHEYINQTFS